MSSPRPLTLAVGLVLAAGVSLPLAPDPYAWVALVGLAALTCAWSMPLSWAVFGWATLLPIWSLGSLPPAVLEVARIGLGLVIAVRAFRTGGPANSAIRSWAWPLAFVGALLAALSWWRGEDLTTGLFMLASVFLVTAALWRLPSVWPIFLGFATGTSVSAAVLIMTALGVGGVEFLVPNTNPGFSRYTGLGTSAPRVSSEFAAAAMIWWAAIHGRRCRGLVGAVGMVISLVALMLCGGRTGVFGLGIAVVLILARRWLRPPLAIAVATIAGLAAYWISSQSVTLNTLTRFSPASSEYGGFSTGRLGLVGEAWSSFLTAPLLGPGSHGFLVQYGLSPHLPPLAYALSGGIVAGGVVLFLTLRLLGLLFAGWGGSPSALTRVGCLVAAILVGQALLEPNGPFLGIEMLTLLFSVVIALSVIELGDPDSRTPDMVRSFRQSPGGL